MSIEQVYGQQGTSTTDDDFNTLSFVFWLLMQKVQTNTLVKVLSCTNDGGLSPVGTVTVQPCVNQMTGARQAIAHGPIYNCLYSRMTGGDNAIILDPKEGDFGMMSFCSRDISGVVANQGPANPGSFRMFDWADGVFTMNVPLGKTPSQYVRFSDTDGIVIVSPTKITLQAPTVEIDASSLFKVISGATDMDSTFDTTIGGATVELDATGTATISGAAINLAGPLTQTSGGTASLGALTAASVETTAGTNLDTHKHPAGTLVAGATPVTGDTAAP
jgi:Phage protein Gp138 N-terminal domain